MSNLNRRDFLKVLGVTSTSTVVACDPPASPVTRTLTPIEQVLPYVVQPEQLVPGLSTWFATSCNECDAGCGVLARNREGRVIKLEGNPQHPVNAGALCARGQAGLQGTYSPDRYKGPSKPWEEALSEVATAVKTAKASGKQVAWLGRHRTGSLATLVGQFIDAAGGTAVFWEPLADHALKAASKASFGIDGVPRFVLDDAHTIVSFGSEILGVAGNPSHARGWANSRDPKHGDFISKLVTVGARVGSTAALADVHFAAAPGTETGIALALAKLVADKKKGTPSAAAALLSGVDPAALASAAGVSVDRLSEVADWMVAHKSAVLPGGPATSAAATSLATAVMLLNEVAGNMGATVRWAGRPNMGAMGSWADAKTLLDDCAAGKVGVLFIDELDPVYAMPTDAGVAEAIAKAGLVVHLANEPNDSVAPGQLVLPPGTTLETWGDAEAHQGVHTLQQPGMMPLYDSQMVGDVLLSIAKTAGMLVPAADDEADPSAESEDGDEGEVFAPAMPGLDTDSYQAYLVAWWASVVWHRAGQPGTIDTFWTQSLKDGGVWFEEDMAGASFQLAAAPDANPVAVDGDLKLVVFAHPFLHDGRHANKAWAQEVPEPLSSMTWGTWIEINLETAEKLGLKRDEAATITAGGQTLEVSWFGNPSIRKDTVAIVMGNGHDNSGRYSRYGANPMKMLASKIDAGGAFNFVSTGAKVAPVPGKEAPAKRELGSLTKEGRGVNYVVSAEDLGHGHDSHHLLGMHHPPVDSRLTDRGLNDMFPEPHHPTYRFAMALDLNRCTGCGACETACYAENNVAIVGPDEVKKSRHMGWIRLGRYWEGDDEFPDVRFQPVMCQQCSHAPCEGVCPVLATYHNLDGLNAMIYNRCVGTRYCANNCPYSARRFNYHTYRWPETYNLQLSPDVLTREMGVMEKCTFCIQRVRAVKDEYRDNRFNGSGGATTAPDGALRKLTACAQACPAEAITFGNANDADGAVSKLFADERAHSMLGELNTKPGVRYLARINHIPSIANAGGGHGSDHGEDDAHGEGAGEAHGAAKDNHDGDAAH